MAATQQPLDGVELSPTTTTAAIAITTMLSVAWLRPLPIARTHSPESRSICPGEYFRSRKFDRSINYSVSISF
ncbi:hypothetical protein ALC53_08454 [Atta colombica]|uniref:Uncharacterized protein n=1 Tax=Atta colombica TaxID=520822 RepID=A0A195BA53_9HYME|nr:hypothetical protein ALC53_08454 [Atta colombica]